jgi:hypothetical protein
MVLVEVDVAIDHRFLLSWSSTELDEIYEMEEYATIDRIKAESFQTVKTSATKDKLMSYLKR